MTEMMAWVSVWWVRDLAMAVAVCVAVAGEGWEGDGKVVGVRWEVDFWFMEVQHILLEIF